MSILTRYEPACFPVRSAIWIDRAGTVTSPMTARYLRPVATEDELGYGRAYLAGLEALRALPVEPYVGLELPEAQELAAREGREIRVLQSLKGPRRADLRFNRLNVALDAEGIVTAADAG